MFSRVVSHEVLTSLSRLGIAGLRPLLPLLHHHMRRLLPPRKYYYRLDCSCTLSCHLYNFIKERFPYIGMTISPCRRRSQRHQPLLSHAYLLPLCKYYLLLLSTGLALEEYFWHTVVIFTQFHNGTLPLFRNGDQPVPSTSACYELDKP